MRRLPNPKWLPRVAVALALWAAALGLWWADLRDSIAPAPSSPPAAEVRSPVGVTVPSPSTAATSVSSPLTVPVVRQAGLLVAREDWLALASSFDTERALADIAELTRPVYAGRAVGSPGGRLAAEWIASRFAESGLQPAGDDGSYLQEFPVPYGELTAMPELEVLDGTGQPQKEYRFRYEYTIWVGGYADGGEAEGPVVWVSDGAHDDYDVVDVEGSIVLCRYQLPLEDKLRQAMEHGARAVLLLTGNEAGFRMRRQARQDALLPQGIPTLIVGATVGKDLLVGSGLTLDDLTIQYQARPLQSRVRLTVPLRYEDSARGQNVLGVLPGSDPDGERQVIVIGAHYDHLGADPDGTTWPGANDNASGVAVLLEIARQWKDQGYVPKRTVLFAAWDGEEIGLYGSDHYVANPRYPLTETVGMLQLDMVGAGTETLWIDRGGIVAEQTLSCAAQLGVPVQTQSMGRSDHAPFVGAGVPATLCIWWYGVDPRVIYHVPEDDLGNIEPDKLRSAGQLAHLFLLSSSWEAEELEDLADQWAQAISSGDAVALLRTVNPQDAALQQQQEAWLRGLHDGRIAELAVSVSAALSGSDVATSTVTLRHRHQATDPLSTMSYSARWVRRSGSWFCAGPAWDEIRGQHVSVLHLQQPAEAAALAESADRFWEFLGTTGGLDVPANLTIRFVGRARDARQFIGALASTPERSGQLLGWTTSDGLVVVDPAAVRPAMAEFALQRSGWVTTTASWLAQGLAELEAEASDPATPLGADYMALLEGAGAANELWTVGTMPARNDVDPSRARLWTAQAWAMTSYVVQSGGWSALRQPTFVALDAWQAAVLSPWQDASRGIRDTLDQRQAAVFAGDKAGFLSTVDAADPVLLQEESHWFDDLALHPAETLAYESRLLSLSGDRAKVQLTLQYRLAEPESRSERVQYAAMFVRRGGRWLYADVDFLRADSTNFVLKYMTAEQGRLSQALLEEAERAYALVSDDLEFRAQQPIEIKLYAQGDLFRASIFLSMPQARGWTEPGEAIKLNNALPPGAGGTIAHELAHQALFSRGVQHAGVHEGTAQYETAHYDPQWFYEQVRKWRQQVYDLVRSGRPVNLAALTDWREWQQDEPRLVYNLGWDNVAFFRERYGRGAFLRWLDLLGSGLSFEDAFAQATGTALAEFDAAWRESVLRGHIDPQTLETARQFSGDRALEHVQTLAQTAWGGRAAGGPGNSAATLYVAERFEEYGLLPAGVDGTYLQPFAVSPTALVTTPALALTSTNGQEEAEEPLPSLSLQYRTHFREVIGGNAGGGQASGQVVYIGGSLDDSRLGGRVLLVRNGGDPARDAFAAQTHGASGVLLATDRRAQELTDRSNDQPPVVEPTIPVFELTEEAVASVLELSGLRPRDLANAPPALPLLVVARMELQLAVTPQVTVSNVLGVLPGSDAQVQDQVLIVGAHLDHVGSLPDGTVYPGANNDGSGMGVLLEVARLWREHGYRPRRTVIFAAWNATELGLLGSRHYVSSPFLPLANTLAVVQLDMVGQGRGYYIDVSAEESQAALIVSHLDNAARQVEGRLAFSSYRDGSDHEPFRQRGIPAALVSWELPENVNEPSDVADAVDVKKLEATGRVIGLALMTMADE